MNQHEELMNRLREVEMDVTVRFGKTELPLREVAELGGGSMIELNKTVDDPVELLINNNPFARGEVVVVDGYYSVRVTEVSPPEKVSNTFLVGAGTAVEEAEFDETPDAGTEADEAGFDETPDAGTASFETSDSDTDLQTADSPDEPEISPEPDLENAD